MQQRRRMPKVWTSWHSNWITVPSIPVYSLSIQSLTDGQSCYGFVCAIFPLCPARCLPSLMTATFLSDSLQQFAKTRRGHCLWLPWIGGRHLGQFISNLSLPHASIIFDNFYFLTVPKSCECVTWNEFSSRDTITACECEARTIYRPITIKSTTTAFVYGSLPDYIESGNCNRMAPQGTRRRVIESGNCEY